MKTVHEASARNVTALGDICIVNQSKHWSQSVCGLTIITVDAICNSSLLSFSTRKQSLDSCRNTTSTNPDPNQTKSNSKRRKEIEKRKKQITSPIHYHYANNLIQHCSRSFYCICISKLWYRSTVVGNGIDCCESDISVKGRSKVWRMVILRTVREFTNC